ncbi:MAG: adenylate/guanylate cyclase domain-containing protein [Geminicoccaceae bacterium]|nr:adenylate/guanylate cyclase domain-containing protein [Geminicoccaceae bacterium]MDW8371870.1 adenylate/guanylate cyclase domain-containing protein [Geminicoccaceae bacterium]
MAGSPVERRLVALVMLDLVGYPRLMGQDEGGTFERVAAHRREVVEPAVAAHRGRIVKLTGDGALCELPSLVEAVECARLLQRATEERERTLPQGQRLRLRIGVTIGDVMQDEDGDVFGEGVNLAARLEALAEPGGICLSATAYEEVRGKVGCRFEDLGERTLENIDRPIRVFRVVEGAAAAPPGPRRRRFWPSSRGSCRSPPRPG